MPIMGHETYSLVKDEVAAEEQAPIKVKGFAEPVRCYKVLGLYDNLAKEGAVICEESDGFKLRLVTQQHHSRPRHVADEARHPDTSLLADRSYHEVRRVADIGVGAHEHRAGRDRKQGRGCGRASHRRERYSLAGVRYSPPGSPRCR